MMVQKTDLRLRDPTSGQRAGDFTQHFSDPLSTFQAVKPLTPHVLVYDSSQNSETSRDTPEQTKRRKRSDLSRMFVINSEVNKCIKLIH